ncbi:MAG: hypothetical protein IPJ13_22385 [Saprospiraceae bacterium]|nr:hypothetical protein [Saprospiraceae bacterium]
MTGVTLLSIFLDSGVAVIGDIPKGLPIFHFNILSAISEYNLILMPALTLAALGAIDSLLTSVVADNVTKTSHNSNK